MADESGDPGVDPARERLVFSFPLGVDDSPLQARCTLAQAYGVGAWVWWVLASGLLPGDAG